MQTSYLPEEIVDAYLADFAHRLLEQNGSNERPELWVAVGNSGDVIFDRLMGIAPELFAPVIVANRDRDTKVITYEGGEPSRDVPQKRVCVIDSSVHSGSTMAAIVDAIAKHSPASVSSYTLVLKRSAVFVPSLWGVTINDHDRAYFLLKRIPNNRLSKRDHSAHLQLLRNEDIGLPPVVSDLPSLDRITWADRFYDAQCSERDRRTYLLRVSDRVIGYLTVTRVGNATMRVDELAVDKTEQGKGFAGTLLRWADTCARQADCEIIEMWAIAAKVPVYEYFGFKPTPGVPPMDLGGEIYHRMRKRIIYHVKPADQ